MKVEVNFERAPPLTEWASEFADRGWKFTTHTEDVCTGRKLMGQSRFPVRNAVQWHVKVETDDSLRVRMTVPAFADSMYARQRLLAYIQGVADALDGDYETEESFIVDFLAELTDGEGASKSR